MMEARVRSPGLDGWNFDSPWSLLTASETGLPSRSGPGDIQMTRKQDNNLETVAPPALRPTTLRLGFALSLIASLTVFAVRAEAQPAVHAHVIQVQP